MIKSQIIRIDPKKLRLLEMNARYMRHEAFSRLVENLKADGGIHGDIPLAWQVHDDTTQTPILSEQGEPIYEVLSGNHRAKASAVAGIAEIDISIITDYLAPDKRRALQLSRNAITGEDDPATLKLIYESITDHTLKLYSGLDDKQLKLMSEVTTASLSEANLTFQTVSMTFLPDELTQLQTVWDEAKKAIPAKGHWLMRYADYDKALDALETVSQAYNIKNTATTFMLMLDIFMRHRDELTDAFLTPEGEPVNKSQRVPIVSLLNSDTISASTGAKLKKALARLDKDPLIALDKLIDLASDK